MTRTFGSSAEPDFAAKIQHGMELYADGKIEDAAGVFGDLNKQKPNNRTIILTLARCYFQISQLDDAISILEDALKHFPNDTRILSDLGYYLFAGKYFCRSAEHLNLIPQEAAEFPQSFRLLVEALIRSNELQMAANHLASPLVSNLNSHDYHYLSALLNERLRNFPKSLEHAQMCVSAEPGIAQHQLVLARSLIATGDAAGALEAYQQATTLTRQQAYGRARQEDRLWLRKSRLSLATQQLRHLIEAYGCQDLREAAEIAEGVLAGIPESDDSLVLSGKALEILAEPLLIANTHAPINGTIGPALRHTIDWSTLAHELEASGLVVVDNFLRPEMLEALRRHLDGSTIWFDDRFTRGYVSAVLGEGLESREILALGTEIRDRLSPLLADHPMSTAWAFRYGRDAEGVEPHADYSQYTVNYWITDEAANLDPDTGGMHFFDSEAADTDDFNAYNGSETDILAKISGRPLKQRVKYKGNRAVIFRSAIFHASDDIRFNVSFEQQRMNITMAFGYR